MVQLHARMHEERRDDRVPGKEYPSISTGTKYPLIYDS